MCPVVGRNCRVDWSNSPLKKGAEKWASLPADPDKPLEKMAAAIVAVSVF
jgi:hypothetical protein